MSKFIEKILEILQKQAEETVDILDIIFSDKTTSYRKAQRSLLRGGPPSFKNDWADWYRRRQAFYSLLNKLKREGFITKKDKKGSPWSITRRGTTKLAHLKLKQQPKYRTKTGKKLIIITFDVPERERHKRDKLRKELVHLGFNKLQQSVWVSRVEIPQDFIKEIKNLGLLDYVQLFSVDKEGTVSKYQRGHS